MSDPKYNVDMFLGIGGGPEGVLSAAALDTYDCYFQGRFIFDNEDDIKFELFGASANFNLIEI